MAERRSRRAARPLMAALGALALAGCAADYVGDDWQCPLAQGKVCASVAAADPALPTTQGMTGPAADIPADRRIDGRIAAGAPAGRVEPACKSDRDPFAWFAGLFAGRVDSESGKPERAAAGRDDDIAEAGRTVSPRNRDAAPVATASPSADLAAPTAGTAHDPAGTVGTDETADAIAVDALRTGEAVARIWIAPFVDADGIYREGSWVRAVIAPAAWRLP